jgi:hypothetical protein
MVGVLGEHASVYLKIFAVITLVLFAIPIAFAPMAWARALKWDIDAKPHLALYFGRCLGAVAIVISCAAWYAAGHPEVQRFYIGIQIGVAVLVGAAHVVGAIQRVQPWTETAEIAFWIALVVLGLLFLPAIPA